MIGWTSVPMSTRTQQLLQFASEGERDETVGYLLLVPGRPWRYGRRPEVGAVGASGIAVQGLASRCRKGRPRLRHLSSELRRDAQGRYGSVAYRLMTSRTCLGSSCPSGPGVKSRSSRK